MKTAQVVIGANYGDEGKGLVTDFLASQTENPLVIRHNSSAQAGHTVVAPDGRRHVFHHIGSGAFSGASTLLGRAFVVHPMLLGEELAALEALGVTPTLYVDPRARVATPFDMLLNQSAELARQAARHGSCGIGFGEAVERSLRPAFDLRVRDFARPDWVLKRLCHIRDGWVPRRLQAMGITIPEEQQTLLSGDDLLWRWLEDMSAFHARTVLTEPGTLPPGRPIFEGAQGLLLDAEGDDFPHVTRARTGLPDVVRMAQETGIENLDVTYVTRAYMTRHGAGPLAGELAETPQGVIDPTNRPNAFQGTIRFAWLDLDSLAARIQRDRSARVQGISISASLAVTCLDQIKDLKWVAGGKWFQGGAARFVKAVEAATGVTVRITSRGPTRNAVQWTTANHRARRVKVA